MTLPTTPAEVSKRCCKRIYGGSMQDHPCTRKAKVQFNGNWYCGIHDPVAVNRKNAERQKKWETEWDAERKEQAKANRLAKATPLAFDLLTKIVALEDSGDSTKGWLHDIAAEAKAILEKL